MDAPSLTTGRILRLWWPLAASWLLMGAELPLVTMFVARMADPEVHLAAYGSIVFPISLFVEAPIIMLLSASTALATDRLAFLRLRRFTVTAAGALTVVHAALAFTPLFDLLARDVMGAPAEVIEPGRTGLRIMTPWTAAIAYRRFLQGILIRFEHSRAVVLGTAVRLVAGVTVLATGLAYGRFPGIVVGSSAVVAGVVAEALFAAWCTRPVIRAHLATDVSRGEPLTRSRFLRFYVPLAATPVLVLAVQPITAAAMGRMPLALASLAAWPAVHGFVFLARSAGFATNEVVVTLIGRPGAVRALHRFVLALAVTTSGVLALVALTPLGRLWFGSVSGLPDELVALASTALLFAVPLPACQAIASFHLGALVHGHRTRGVTEAMALYLVVAVAGLAAGVALGRHAGLLAALTALSVGNVVQAAWLAHRSRPLVRELQRAEAG